MAFPRLDRGVLDCEVRFVLRAGIFVVLCTECFVQNGLTRPDAGQPVNLLCGVTCIVR